MYSNKIIDINDIYRSIMNAGFTLKYVKSRLGDGLATYMAVFEKRILRNGQIATASLLTIQGGRDMSIDVISAGGGKAGIVNMNDSVNKDVYEKVIDILSSLGFEKEGVDEYYPS